jgi:hypothetical protein
LHAGLDVGFGCGLGLAAAAKMRLLQQRVGQRPVAMLWASLGVWWRWQPQMGQLDALFALLQVAVTVYVAALHAVS